MIRRQREFRLWGSQTLRQPDQRDQQDEHEEGGKQTPRRDVRVKVSIGETSSHENVVQGDSEPSHGDI